jgi:hypothetical protein
MTTAAVVQRAGCSVQRPPRLRILGVVAAFLAVGSCDAGPKAGEIVFGLTTPNQDDGAIQFVLTAAAPNTLDGVAAACTGCQVFTETVSETEIRGVLLGNVVPGDALRVLVSDRNAKQVYGGQVVAAASRTYALRATSGYGLSLAE